MGQFRKVSVDRITWMLVDDHTYKPPKKLGQGINRTSNLWMSSFVAIYQTINLHC